MDTQRPRTDDPPAKGLFSELFGEVGEGRWQIAFLDATGTFQGRWPVQTGEINATGFPVRRIIADALVRRSRGLLLAHTHGDGDPTPSSGDIAETRRLAEVGRPLDIRVADHFVISRTGWTSFRDLGLI